MNLKGKIVLVTGADGFLGSHLVEELLKQKANVIAISMYNSFNLFGWLNYIKKNKNLKIILGDIRDPYFFKKKINKVDIIYNLAALISVPHSLPYSYFANNILGTLNLLELANEKKVKNLFNFHQVRCTGLQKNSFI